MKANRLVFFLFFLGCGNSAFGSSTNYVLGAGLSSNFSVTSATATSTGSASTADFYARPEPQILSSGSFIGMPRSAYKVTITVRCSVMKTLGVSGPGQGALTENGLFYLRAVVDRSSPNVMQLPEVEACISSRSGFTPVSGAISTITENQTQTYTLITPMLRAGQHDFDFGAEVSEKGTVSTATSGTSITYIVTPTIRIEQVIIEPIILKNSQ